MNRDFANFKFVVFHECANIDERCSKIFYHFDRCYDFDIHQCLKWLSNSKFEQCIFEFHQFAYEIFQFHQRFEFFFEKHVSKFFDYRLNNWQCRITKYFFVNQKSCFFKMFQWSIFMFNFKMIFLHTWTSIKINLKHNNQKRFAFNMFFVKSIQTYRFLIVV